MTTEQTSKYNVNYTLLLNSSFEPLRICSWERAVCLWLDGRVEILSTYTGDSYKVYSQIDDWSGYMPAVIRMKKYVRTDKQKVKFSRVNVFGRDGFKCCYCSESLPPSHLTYDHVKPRSRGGKTCWENIVTCCLPCNSKKADRTPEEAGMFLRSMPYKPKVRPALKVALSSPHMPVEWREYVEYMKSDVA